MTESPETLWAMEAERTDKVFRHWFPSQQITGSGHAVKGQVAYRRADLPPKVKALLSNRTPRNERTKAMSELTNLPNGDFTKLIQLDADMGKLMARVKDIEAENAALKEQLAGKWLPIENAPKDGTEVDLHDGEIRHTDCFYNLGVWWTKKGWPVYDSMVVGCTHFYLPPPLPPAPKGE